MTILAFPTLSRAYPQAWRWRKISNTSKSFDSPFTGSSQTQVMPGARWAASASWSALQAADSAILSAWLASLRGQAGRCYRPYYGKPFTRGSAPGTPLVFGANQAGATLATDGWTTGATLLAGDMIGLNAGLELRMVIANVTANGLGRMTITLDEPMRTSPSDNSAIVTRLPTCQMRLAADDYEIDHQAGGLASLSLEFVEAWT